MVDIKRQVEFISPFKGKSKGRIVRCLNCRKLKIKVRYTIARNGDGDCDGDANI